MSLSCAANVMQTCDKEPAVLISYQAPIKLPHSFSSNVENGRVEFSFDIGHDGVIENINLLHVEPSNLPLQPINKMIKKSKFKLVSNCFLRNFKMEITFDIPKGIDLKFKT